MKTALQNFLKMEAASGIVLMIAAVAAMIAANTPLIEWYVLLLDVPVEIRIGTFEIAKPLLLWINDGLMAIFFFLIGLELKREVLEGELSRPADVLFPAAGALGGIVVPIGIYFLINRDDPDGLAGWAVPAATDIAFALGILMLLGTRVPLALKVFVVSLAIFDDLAAIIIIAIFYSGDLSMTALAVDAVSIGVLAIMAKRGVPLVTPYVWIGVIMWAALIKSGVHATLAGVALAMFIPIRHRDDPDRSPLRELEHDLHYVVAFGILPIFAFVNAGVPLNNVTFADLLHPVPLGIAAGLFIGKQLGITAFCWIAVKTGLAKLPKGTTWGSLYGAALLCGVGFTMSLFIGSLAFEGSDARAIELFDERVGILIGSALSGVMGYVVLRMTLPPDES